MRILSIIALALLISFSACQEDIPEDQVELQGIIREMGTTTYGYGTHIIENGDEFYAIKSDNWDLNFFLNKYVTAVGEKVPGYPIDGGPEFVNVYEIQE